MVKQPIAYRDMYLIAAHAEAHAREMKEKMASGPSLVS